MRLISDKEHYFQKVLHLSGNELFVSFNTKNGEMTSPKGNYDTLQGRWLVVSGKVEISNPNIIYYYREICSGEWMTGIKYPGEIKDGRITKCIKLNEMQYLINKNNHEEEDEDRLNSPMYTNRNWKEYWEFIDIRNAYQYIKKYKAWRTSYINEYLWDGIKNAKRTVPELYPAPQKA